VPKAPSPEAKSAYGRARQENRNSKPVLQHDQALDQIKICRKIGSHLNKIYVKPKQS
jgi:hypothetical protein